MIDALQGFDSIVNEAVKSWKTPGVGLAVVKDGEVIYSIGSGFRDKENQLPLTPDSIFAIGSTSKAFTAASIGILVDDGKLEWDKPIRNYIPEFRMYDPVATENLSVRDMLCHRSGLPRHEMVWYRRQISRRDLMKTLAYLEPNEGFRNRWQYQNIIYATTGLLVEAVTGKTWEEFVQERILDPLGMTSTNFSVSVSEKSDDFCYPYLEKDGEVKRISFANIDPIGPAGSINSTLLDMCKWMAMNMNHGKANGQQVISEGNLGQLHRPQMTIMEDNPMSSRETDSYNDYGMGWVVYMYRGVPVLEHTGGIDGFATEVMMVPGQQLGVVSFSNTMSGAPMALARIAIDRILGLEPIDWLKRYRESYEKAMSTIKEMGKGPRKEGTKPTHPLKDFTGKFTHPGYGEIEFLLKDEALFLLFRGWEVALSHVHYNVFDGELPVLGIPFKFTFEMDDQGNIERVSSPFDVTVKPIVFTRVPDDAMKQRGFLEQFEGEYELMGQTLRIALKGEDALCASGPGMPEMELVPYRGTTFTLKGMEVVSLEFKMNGGEKAAEVVMTQPGAV
ncbi:MAG: serine hydrolase, partial [Anaerolineaceae bacterium]